MNNICYPTGKDQFNNYKFDPNEWSACYLTDASEIKSLIDRYDLVGRKIKAIKFIGLCYDLRRDQLEDFAYCFTEGAEEERQKKSDYENIPDDFPYFRSAEIDEPLLIQFEDEKSKQNRVGFSHSKIFAILTPQTPTFRMSLNAIPWWIEAGTNAPNMDANAFFSPCIGKTVSEVEVYTYKTNLDPMTSEPFEDGKEREFVSGIILRLEDDTGIKIEHDFDFCHVSCIDAKNNIQTIRFHELKKGIFNWEDLHADRVTGFEAYNSTLFFGKCGAEHCHEPYMTFSTENSNSILHISVDDFVLFRWCISDLFEWFDEYKNYQYSFKDWQKILSEAEKLLSFSSFDELFEYRISLPIRKKDRHGGNSYLEELNIGGCEFWNHKDEYKRQLEEMKEWSSLVFGENETIFISGF